MTSFTQLPLNATIQSNIKALEYFSPTQIQQAACGAIIAGKDVYMIAPTGTGKSAAYLLPILQRLSESDYSEQAVRPIRALVVVPTRELAVQVEAFIKSYAAGLKLRTISVYGGERIESQLKRFKRGCDLLVATPKRLVDLVRLDAFALNKVEHCVLDEADRLVSMGIQPLLKKILQSLPKQRQSLLVSATETAALKQFSQAALKQPQSIQADLKLPPLEKIKHTFYRCKREEKRTHLFELLSMLNCDRALIFTRTKNDVNQLSEALNEHGFTSQGLHNEIPQKKRQQRLADFKQKQFKFLVATDIASRGLDIGDLYYVINFDLPVNANDYVHRVGRTARTGSSMAQTKQESSRQAVSTVNKKTRSPWLHPEKPKHYLGESFSLVSREQERLMDKIAKAVGKELRLERLKIAK
ncbi:DEAD/DEAH box helicase [Aliikangiella sp. IMCC44632]